MLIYTCIHIAEICMKVSSLSFLAFHKLLGSNSNKLLCNALENAILQNNIDILGMNILHM